MYLYAQETHQSAVKLFFHLGVKTVCFFFFEFFFEVHQMLFCLGLNFLQAKHSVQAFCMHLH